MWIIGMNGVAGPAENGSPDEGFSSAQRAALRDVSDALHGAEGILLLYDEEADAFAVVADKGKELEAMVGYQVAAQQDESLVDFSQRPSITLTEPSRAFPWFPDAARAFNSHKVALVPLIADQPVGIVVLSATDGERWDAEWTSVRAAAERAAWRIQAARPDFGHSCIFRRILDLDPGGIAVVEGPDHVYSFAGTTYRQILNSVSVPFLGRQVRHVLQSPRREWALGLLEEVRRSGQPYHASSIEFADEFGSRHFELHLIPDKDEGGSVRACFIILWPRTEVVMIRRALESSIVQLSESQGVLSAVLNHTNNGMVLVGTDGTVLYANRRMDEFFGTDVTRMLGRSFLQVVQEELMDRVIDPDDFARRLLSLQTDPDVTTVDEVEIVRPTRRILDRYSAPVRKEDGTLLGRIEVYSDVTEVRQLQRNKDDFLSLVSHELRTPITSIKGYAQLLQRRAGREEVPAPTVQAYASIERQAARMQELIDLLLDLSRLETGRLSLQLSEFDLRTMVVQTIEMLKVTSEDHSIVLQLPDGAVWIQGDERRLEQVIVNLVSNATSYSPGGSAITVCLSLLEGAVVLTVRDEGVGIPADAHERIFERFFRAPEVPQSTGLGIGLYITRGIVDRHGGSITVQSSPGRGSTFTVTLPTRAPAAS